MTGWGTKIKLRQERQDLKSSTVIMQASGNFEDSLCLETPKEKKKKAQTARPAISLFKLQTEGISCWEPFKDSHQCVMVVSAPSVCEVNCYLINNLLLISKRCCSNCWNANGCATHRIERDEATGRDSRAAQLVFGPEKKITARKTLRGVLHVSARVCFHSFLRQIYTKTWGIIRIYFSKARKGV